MRKLIAILALLVVALTSWEDAEACSCLRPDLSVMYKASARVILGEVVAVDVQTENPVHGQEVTYIATVKPVETYKGTSSADVRVTFTGHYSDPSHPLPAPVEAEDFGERTLTIVGGCPSGAMAVGDKYVIFEKQGEQLHRTGWCDGRIQYWERIVLDYMRGLRDAR